MQGITLWEGSSCPLCETQGINSRLKFFRLNFRVAALLCKRNKCPFPLSTNYPDTFVHVGQDGKIIPGSQSERVWQHEEEDGSDDSPYISDASEESVTFPDIVPEFKKLSDVSAKNKNATGASEVDAFDISTIDFETDDSMDSFKLQNEITSLEMEITKTVEKIKSVSSHDNCKGSTMLESNNENCRTPSTVAANTSSNDNVCTDYRPLDINNSCLKIDENEVECCDDRKSGNIILCGHGSRTSISGRLEISKMSEELANCMQQSEAKIHISDKSVLSNKHADIKKSGNKCSQAGGSIDDDHHGGGPEGVKTISNSNCSDSNAEKEVDFFSVEDTSNPESKPSLLLTPQGMKNTLENDLSKKCELHAELVTSESVNLTDCSKEKCGNKEIEIIFDDHKNGDSSDNNVEKQLDTFPITDISTPKPEQSVLLTPQGMKNTVGNDLPRTESVTEESVAFNKDNDSCKGMDIIFDDNVKSDSIVEKQLDSSSMAGTSTPKPEPSVLLIPQVMKNSVGNDSPIKPELHAQLVTSNLVTFKEDNGFGNNKCDSNKMDVVFDDEENIDVYEIVTVDSDTSPTGSLDDSKDCEVFNVEFNEQHDVKNGVACSDSAIPPSVKVKIVEEKGLFVCTAKIFSAVEESNQLQKTPVKNKAHSKNCICFLCRETNKKGITSHLDRALADLFPEEHPIEKQVTERDVPTAKQIMKDLVHYMTGNSSLQNTKKNRRKRKRLFHL